MDRAFCHLSRLQACLQLYHHQRRPEEVGVIGTLLMQPMLRQSVVVDDPLAAAALQACGACFGQIDRACPELLLAAVVLRLG